MEPEISSFSSFERKKAESFILHSKVEGWTLQGGLLPLVRVGLAVGALELFLLGSYVEALTVVSSTWEEGVGLAAFAVLNVTVLWWR